MKEFKHLNSREVLREVLKKQTSNKFTITVDGKKIKCRQLG